MSSFTDAPASFQDGFKHANKKIEHDLRCTLVPAAQRYNYTKSVGPANAQQAAQRYSTQYNLPPARHLFKMLVVHLSVSLAWNWSDIPLNVSADLNCDRNDAKPVTVKGEVEWWRRRFVGDRIVESV